MTSAIPRDVLVGLVELKPHTGNDELEGAPGAYANVVTRAANEIEFRNLVAHHFRDMGYDIVHVRDIESAAQRAEKGQLSATLIEAAHRVAHADAVAWDTFYIYESEDDE